MLELFLLGRPQVFLDGQAVEDFVSEKALALLCYLAARKRNIPRHSLAGLLWGGMPEERARANLRMALYNLQQLLPGYLAITRLEAGLDRQRACWLDIEAFTLQAARVAELYRGDFLEGLSLNDAPEFDEWLLVERERLRQLALGLLNELASQQTAQGAYNEAAGTLRRSLALDAWQEDVYRQLMLALARSGDTTAALAQYATCRRVLAEELGLEPMPETSALYERLKTLRAAPRHPSLPLQPTPFIGRQEELHRLARLLVDPAARLVTILGPGGIGKTRLALEAAHAHRNTFLEGVYFVSLAPLAEGEEIIPAILAALNLPPSEQLSPQEQLIRYLSVREVLLVLDNFEHLLAGVDQIKEILEKTAHVHLLVTSRERLSLRWEILFPIEGLAYPTEPAPSGLETYSAAALFLQGCRRLLPGFELSQENGPAVARLCQLTEGLPLALELAAAWIVALPLEEMVDALQKDLDVLTTPLRDVPERHRSLRAAIDHSWQLLSAGEREAFRKLAVFRGGFTPEAAAAVIASLPGHPEQTPQELVTSLVAKSLLRLAPTGRYEIHEMLRQYAAEKLAASPQVERSAREAHSSYFATFLHQWEAGLYGERMGEALRVLRSEMDNLRTAWRWASEAPQSTHLARGLKALARFYTLTGLLSAGESAFLAAATRLRERIAAAGSPSAAEEILLGRLLVEQARFQTAQARHAPALEALQGATELIRAQPDPGLEAAIQLQWAEIHERQGEYAAAGERYARALELARQAEQPLLEGGSLVGLGILTGDQGDVEGAKSYFRQALGISQRFSDRRGEMAVLHNLAIAAMFQNDYVEAKTDFEGGLRLAQEMGNQRHEIFALLGLSFIAAHFGEYAAVESHNARALQLCREIGERREEGSALSGLGLAALSQGIFDEAKFYLEESLRISLEVGNRIGEGTARYLLGLLFRHLGSPKRARFEAEKALELNQGIGTRRDVCLALIQLALLRHQAGDPQEAQVLGHQALEIAHQLGEQTLVAHALTILGYSLASLGRPVEAAEKHQTALAIRREIGQLHLGIENLAALAENALARKELAAAQRYTEEILGFVADRPLEGADEPARVYLAGYRVLEALGDPRAPQVLASAHDFLRGRAAHISSQELRRSFWENMGAHREIRRAWEAGQPLG